MFNSNEQLPMAESQSIARFLNPWFLHLQKLGLELKCPLCLNLLNQPMLLPCNHIFCNFCIPKSTQFGSECPACKYQYVDREIRPAPFMDNVVTIYRSLDATCNANLSQSVSSDTAKVSLQCPSSGNTKIDDKLRQEPVETPQEGNSCNRSLVLPLAADKCVHIPLNLRVEDGIELIGKSDIVLLSRSGMKEDSEMYVGSQKALNGEGKEVIDMNQVTQLVPSSPPSLGDARYMDSNTSDPGSSNDSIEKYTTKRLVENDLDGAGGEVNHQPILGAKSHARDIKRQKKLNYGLFEMDMNINSHTQEKALPSENINYNLEPRFEEPLFGVGLPAISDSSNAKGNVCAFCHRSKTTDGTGPMLHYANGEEVVGDIISPSKVIHVHRKCIEWTPQVYYVGDTIKNLELELARAAKLKCSSCGRKGAALGCFVKSCRRSYHVPCAFEILDCRWDCEDYLLLCPIHSSVKFPKERSKYGKHGKGKNNIGTAEINSQLSKFWATSPDGVKEWVLCGSALSAEEKYLLVKFANICGATVSKFWKPNVTHVIAATDAGGACTRTLKVLMAILKGRWILTMDWVKACMEAMHPVHEEPYEVSVDNHGCYDGPKTGRLRALDNAPKLFNGLNFHFVGDFVQAYKKDLLDLVITAGGTVSEAMDQLVAQTHDAQPNPITTLVVYNLDQPQDCELGEESSIVLQRLEAAKDLANAIGSQVIDHLWILESIAACKLQALPADKASCNEDASL